jgi:hypothetical protein
MNAPRIRLLLLSLLAVIFWACSGGAGEALKDAGQAMVDLGETLEPDAGAQTSGTMKLTLPCTQMDGAVYRGISEPLNVDPTALKIATAIICDANKTDCFSQGVEFKNGVVRAGCGVEAGWIAYVSLEE